MNILPNLTAARRVYEQILLAHGVRDERTEGNDAPRNSAQIDAIIADIKRANAEMDAANDP